MALQHFSTWEVSILVQQNGALQLSSPLKHLNLLNNIARLAALSLGESLKDMFAQINKTPPTITSHRYEIMLT